MNQGIKKFGLWFISNKSFWTLHWRYKEITCLHTEGKLAFKAFDSLLLREESNTSVCLFLSMIFRQTSSLSWSEDSWKVYVSFIEQSWGSRVILAGSKHWEQPIVAHGIATFDRRSWCRFSDEARTHGGQIKVHHLESDSDPGFGGLTVGWAVGWDLHHLLLGSLSQHTAHQSPFSVRVRVWRYFDGFSIEGHLDGCKLDRQSTWRGVWGMEGSWGLHLACILRSDNGGWGGVGKPHNKDNHEYVVEIAGQSGGSRGPWGPGGLVQPCVWRELLEQRCYISVVCQEET